MFRGCTNTIFRRSGKRTIIRNTPSYEYGSNLVRNTRYLPSYEYGSNLVRNTRYLPSYEYGSNLILPVPNWPGMLGKHRHAFKRLAQETEIAARKYLL